MAWSSVTTPVAGTAFATSTFGVPVADNLNLLGGAWTSYTPTTTNVTLGNGTLVAKVKQIGKTVLFEIQLTFGSTTVIAAPPTFTLPATAARSNWRTRGLAFDSSAGASGYFDVSGVADTTGEVIAKTNPTTAGSNIVNVSATNPFTWATGDVLTISGEYEAA